ncbi:MAG TPA: M90 family metallopeptidase [Gammaproteobacteria bacterium]|nr:M90 family metallopeptidase [Gammaproteobacteria bacterium]
MLNRLRAWRERRILSRRPIGESDWQAALAACAPARRLTASDQARLRTLATLFLHEKSVEPVRGFNLSRTDCVVLATHACIPVLNLGLSWYRDWHALVVYPDLFIPKRSETDHAGVVHPRHEVLAGEAWSQGPVILSWQEVQSAGQPPGHNVAIHEMAHKLDMLNGEANGYPPLHAGMRTTDWSRVLTGAWGRLQGQRQIGGPLPLDDYALTSPGEFFAVASETFFEQPEHLYRHLPALYRQLALFYRQRPLADV